MDATLLLFIYVFRPFRFAFDASMLTINFYLKTIKPRKQFFILNRLIYINQETIVFYSYFYYYRFQTFHRILFNDMLNELSQKRRQFSFYNRPRPCRNDDKYVICMKIINTLLTKRNK